MKKLYSFITITILGYLGCADLLFEEKPPVILWENLIQLKPPLS
jgi:hypothetical protein